MEILGEFDNESPLYVSFCKRISPEDFERQSLTYTQKCLHDLYTKMEQNPGICERVVQKRKQLESQEAGLASYLKAKFLSLFNYGGNSLEVEEIQEEAEQLKREMQRASNYAFAAKSASRWPSERKPRRNIPLGRFGPGQTKFLDPAVPAMPRIFGPYPTQAERSAGGNTEWTHPQTNVAVHPNSTLDLHPFMLNPGGYNPWLLPSDSCIRLKSSNFPRTPARNATSPFQNDSPSSSTPGLNTPTLAKPRETAEDKENQSLDPSSHPTGA
ncbi:uncharacterized protein LOC128338075 isoform X2 [Hemicordylus capensis]|uniref:uncharacterized protein LOC128338075 isoform X2 n=1 Tax=Hemicordylus capensis TaxID=884348 RepID=UPI002301FEF6|nr:uncharacterized protein LOC128338075 isoform X2 [Hemicordylus capensis]